MHFEFATSGRILFGPGTLKEAPTAVKSFGTRALVVLGGSRQRAAGTIEELRNQGVETFEFHVSGEPTVATVLSGVEQARADRCDVVLGIGGGSALDAGKAIAALMPNQGNIYNYLEVVGQGRALSQPSAPYVAIPTTAGTGTEATRNAVLAVSERRIKVSLRSPFLLPTLAIVDSELTYSLPPTVTATSGLDALTQLIEPFLSSGATPITDAICREGIAAIAGSLKRAYENGDDSEARENMSLGSLLSGIALANAKLGATHGFAGPLGGMFPAPHGAVCAILLPLVLEANLKAVRERESGNRVLSRFAEVARLLTASPQAQPEDGVFWLRELCAALGIPGLGTYGVQGSDFPEVIAAARKSSSMKGNPVKLTDEECASILENAL
jgi:alcohol dehydrogenase class IV